MKYPAPLIAGSTIGVTAFSSGIGEAHESRYQFVLEYLNSLQFKVIEGNCLRGQSKHVSACVEERASELMQFLMDDEIDAIAPPWGGELAMELLPYLDFEKLSNAKPKWILGFSDISTITSVVTSRLGWATVHCSNLMDLTQNATDPLVSTTLSHLSQNEGESFTQFASEKHTKTWPPITENPQAILECNINTKWKWLVKPESDYCIEGRLLGGCWDTLHHLFNTEYLDLNAFAKEASKGILLYLENAEMPPVELARAILNMKFRQVFSSVNGILIGRNCAKDASNQDELSYLEVLERHLGNLGIPVIYDMDIGHVPPNLTLINGAVAKVTLDEHGAGAIEQTLI
ncbi:LD-carboxypeptidase [Vibrio sp. vnigr-6D03]|uniref:S66 family peptidase n=1 Tax=Vibrio sp. vnigr-6D03 TaxID=2058088 RepID=UPI000C34D6E9|nr:S66 peptidase family protein [Vibrio sp. vnigr-6D03]PKF76558.1 LD-carboxypeptidase [Vibrio sp. vnigr-6D03]